ncbi:putative protein-tyrosine phosphatase [Opitutaceae bacterium TAV1]|nr:putative protein-tyrosine phosphatase [Opitutaceae bacterium TAV1]
MSIPAPPAITAATGAAPASRPWRAACVWLAVIGPLFFLTYGFANHFTAQRAHVPSLAFAWEHHISFLPWTIIPYWSIDLLYVVSVFLCRTRDELRVHALRLAAITLVSVACFLLFPLRFSFTRPETSGFFGLLFDALTSFDLPYNQAPSLHIGLLWIIALRFAAHTPPRWRWSVYTWAALIAVSVLTTWQHHFIDVVTGFAAGVVVAYALPTPARRWRPRLSRPGREEEPARASRRAARIGLRYLAGALAATLPLLAFGHAWWSWLFAWPAAACVLVAAGYFGAGPCIFQKDTRGETAPSAAVLLAPVRLGLWISRRLHTRRLPPLSRIDDHLAIGSCPSTSTLAAPPHIGAVLDLTAEFSRSFAVAPASRPHDDTPCRPSIVYAATPRLDLLPPTLAELDESIAALRLLRDHAPGKIILIHCALGLSRSAIAAAAWLLETGRAGTPEGALDQLRAARPQIVLHPGHLPLLRHWHETRAP